MNSIGPQQGTKEPLSAYRMRYARYCFWWAVGLLLPFLILLALAPNVSAFPAPFSLFLMFLYVGLPLGLGVAVLAGLGFMVGGIWSMALENDSRVAVYWPKAKETLRALALSPVIFFGAFVIVRGLTNKEVLIFARGKGLPVVNLEQDPFGYLASMAVWCAITVGLVVYVYKALRRAYSN